MIAVCLASGAFAANLHAEPPRRPTQETAPTADAPDWTADPEFIESKKAFEFYLSAIRETLVSGTNPRGWILASNMLFANAGRRDPTLIAKAGDAAPNDMFVQWMVTQMSERSSPAWQAAQERLERGEPENGAVWLNALHAASHRNDVDAVDRTLEQMSRSTRFDTYQVTLAKEMIAALSLKPAPDFYLPPESGLPSLRKEEFATLTAYQMTAAFSTPPIADFTRECSAANTSNNRRRINCDISARLMLSTSDTFLLRTIAPRQLCDRHALTFADNEIIRSNDWLYSNLNHVVGDAAADVEARWNKISNILEVGSEVDGMRQYLEKSDVAPIAPADWIDRFAPKAKPEANMSGSPSR